MERDSPAASRKPLLSVIIPAYNERDTIANTIALVRAAPVDKEIIVVDDGSTDGTWEVLRELAGPDLLVLHLLRNFGKGTAIRTAIPHVQGDIVIIQDADAEYDPNEYPKLVAPIVAGQAQVVYGSRFLEVQEAEAGGKSRPRLRWPEGMRPANWFINRLLAVMANVLFRARITDEATCYKVFRAEVLESIQLNCRGFEFCPEVTAKVRRRGIPIMEVPISYKARSFQQGKKINWRDGFRAIWALVKYRFRD